MRAACRVPRLNNNDDTVRIVRLMVKPGDTIRQGDIVAEVATDKATVTVEAPWSGAVIDVPAMAEATIDVGAVLFWMEAPDGAVDTAEAAAGGAATPARPSLKDRLLKKQAREVGRVAAPDPAAADALGDAVRSGEDRPLTPDERAMIRAIEWHHRDAVPAFLEVSYDIDPLIRDADDFQAANDWPTDPTVMLLAWRLAQAAKAQPLLNSAIIGGRRRMYDHVNMGLAVRTERTLYLVVVKAAEQMSLLEFCESARALLDRAAREALTDKDLSGPTIALTSMAQWPVVRHMPVLAPQTSLIVAHVAPAQGVPTLGATYDHRALAGGVIADALAGLTRSPRADSSIPLRAADADDRVSAVLTQCFQQVFPTLAPATVAGASVRTLAAWNSLAMMQLVASVEAAFSRKFEPSQVARMTSFAAISALLR